MLEGAGPLWPAMKPGQVLRLLKDHDIHSCPGNAVHRVSHRYDAQQQVVIASSIKGYFEIR